ncbi:PPOX class F420-dependent oxidoreductase [Nocardia sp. NPDC050406]|uniref:PPOX class F420-dependent oxidoreductase n=1 Tax=Nocardia sp. NPDC050406 TaxID=3364318 RepID=UPI0037B43C86
MSWNDVATAKYALLTTYKKDGTPVGTPVWLAPDGARVLIWTAPKSWKVKRIRRNPQVTLQICDNRGNPRGDEIHPGTAHLLDADGTQRVRDLVGRKYGIVGQLLIKGHKLFRGKDAAIGIAVDPQPAA